MTSKRNLFTTITTFLIGQPLKSADAPHQTISKKVGLAVFASDALSSTAYATEAILEVLAFAVPLAGLVVLGYSVYVSLSIISLLVVVTISYEQTIHAYPGGGGAYIVSRDNLGEGPAQMAGAALLTDYILTVAVSISSGVAQLASGFPALHPYCVHIAVALVAFVMIVNLRGVKESGTAFAIPTYFFLIVMLVTIGVGFFRYFTGTLGRVQGVTPATVEAAQGITLFLILHAFSNGCTALTGVEAISNGITAFQEPKSRNAGITLVWMSSILAVMFLGITFLSHQIGAQFSHTETVISQLGHTVWGAGALWYILLGSTTLILIMAANTAFADFPRLGALHAGDGFLPKQLTYKGSRLVYSYGIVALATFAALLIILFKAKTTALIPLYAIGVFLSFTLSQTGMAVRWWKAGHLQSDEEILQQGGIVRYDPKWRLKLVVNGLGAVLTFTVMVVFAVTKFVEGAWIVVVLVPTLVFIFFRIHHHYHDLAKNLSLDSFGAPPRVRRNRVLLPIGGVNRGVISALRYAHSISDDITAVHVAADPLAPEKIQQEWAMWGDGVRLHVIPSPYRRLFKPLTDYIEEWASQRQPYEMLTIVVPQFVPAHWWQHLLHMNTALILRGRLLQMRGIVVMEVPYSIGDKVALQE